MNLKISWPQLKAGLTYCIGLAAAGFAAYQAVAQSGNPTATAIGAAIILGVVHYVDNPSTGTPAPPVA